PHGAWYVAPGYAYALAGLFAAGCGPLAVKALQLVIGAVSAWLVFRLARSMSSARTACIAACVWALAPVGLRQEVLLPTTAFATACVLAAIAGVMPRDAPGRPRWELGAAAMAAAMLLRGEFVVVALALFAAACMARRRQWVGAPTRRGLAVFAVATAAAVAI